MSASNPVAPSRAGFQHEALLYAAEDDFLAATVPFIDAGIAAGEPVLVALPPDRMLPLRDALGRDADAVVFMDMTELGQNPARIIPAWREFVDWGPAVGRPRRGIGEPIWAGRTEVEVIECQRHEALLNVAFDEGVPWQLMCPYDTTKLPGAVVEEALRSHPLYRVDGQQRASNHVLGSDMAKAHLSDPLPPPKEGSNEFAFGLDDVRAVRDYVAAYIVACDMDPVRGFDLLVAASEIATNSLRHGGGSGVVRVWHDTDTLICEFSDAGALTQPLVGRRLPRVDAEGERGIWLANQLCDLVQIRVFDSGTVVRLHMGLSVARPRSAVNAY
jgi:anti-sigma regulatory factor (Ser/Thr protein kinase)